MFTLQPSHLTFPTWIVNNWPGKNITLIKGWPEELFMRREFFFPLMNFPKAAGKQVFSMRASLLGNSKQARFSRKCSWPKSAKHHNTGSITNNSIAFSTRILYTVHDDVMRCHEERTIFEAHTHRSMVEQRRWRWRWRGWSWTRTPWCRWPAQRWFL